MMTSLLNGRKLYIDIETYCEADLKEVGLYRYVDDDTFEIDLFAYAFDDEPVQVIDLLQGEKIPAEVQRALFDVCTVKVAHNAAFEIAGLNKMFRGTIDAHQWYCTMIRACTLGLPASLDKVGKAIGLKEEDQKMKAGKRLIQFFAKPCAPSKVNGGRTRNLPQHAPDAWDIYKMYNKQDVDVERTIFKEFLKYPEISSTEHALWVLDLRMNSRGTCIDYQMVHNIIKGYNRYEEKHILEARDITGLENPMSMQQGLEWLKQQGLDPKLLLKEGKESIDKDITAYLLTQDLKPQIRRFLEIKKELGKTSIAKYDSMMRSCCSDGRIKGMLQFYGASRTGRWAGRLVQLQNLPQNHLKDLDTARDLAKSGDMDLMDLCYPSVSDTLSQLIRTALVAPKDQTFVVCDYSAIEARVIAWLAGEQWTLDAFNAGKDLYCVTASMMFGVPVEKHGINGELRTKGKIATLACGYQGGVGALEAMDRKREIPEGEKQDIINKWRQANPNVVKLWNACEKAAIDAVSYKGTKQFVPGAKGIYFEMIREHLFAFLPSGRAICYAYATIQTNRFNRSALHYKGQNQTTKVWGDLETYGGKIVENLTQATARDCLAYAMLLLNKENYTPEFHVHDEVVIPVPTSKAKEALQRIKDIMSLKDLIWTKGLPLTAEGYITPYYKKD